MTAGKQCRFQVKIPSIFLWTFAQVNLFTYIAHAWRNLMKTKCLILRSPSSMSYLNRKFTPLLASKVTNLTLVWPPGLRQPQSHHSNGQQENKLQDLYWNFFFITTNTDYLRYRSFDLKMTVRKHFFGLYQKLIVALSIFYANNEFHL